MRRLAVVLCTTLLVGAVCASPAAAAADAEGLHTTSVPPSFRWLPYPGVPGGQKCFVAANDTGVAAVSIAESEAGPSSVWVARASGAHQLLLPAGAPEGASAWAPKISTTGVVAATVATYSGEDVGPEGLIVRWDAQGVGTLSPALPEPPAGVQLISQSVEGVTARGDVVVFQRTWEEEHRLWGVTVMVWTAAGGWSEVHSMTDDNWSARNTSVLSNGTILVGWQDRYTRGTHVMRPRATGSGWTVEWRDSVVDAVSADRQWWAGKTYAYIPPSEEQPEENWVVNFGSAKGLSSPLNPLLTGTSWVEATATAINNQGTMVMWDGEYRWRNGTRVTSIERNITRLPVGGRLHPFDLHHIDTAGRMVTTIDLPDATCRAGLLAPEW